PPAADPARRPPPADAASSRRPRSRRTSPNHRSEPGGRPAARARSSCGSRRAAGRHSAPVRSREPRKRRRRRLSRHRPWAFSPLETERYLEAEDAAALFDSERQFHGVLPLLRYLKQRRTEFPVLLRFALIVRQEWLLRGQCRRFVCFIGFFEQARTRIIQ